MIENFNIIKGLIINQYNAFYLQFLLTDSLTVEIFSHRSMENEIYTWTDVTEWKMQWK